MHEHGLSGPSDRIPSDLQVGARGDRDSREEARSSPPGQAGHTPVPGLTETEGEGEKEGGRHRQGGTGHRAGMTRRGPRARAPAV